MAEFPALPLFTDAYFGDTRHLTCLEHGAYLQLLMTAWRARDCCLPNDDRLLAKYTGLTPAQWRRIKPTILAFFEVDGCNVFQRRLRDEYDHVRQVRASQAANGRASALKRKGRHSTERDARLNGASTPTPTPLKKEREDKSSPKKAVAWNGSEAPDEWIEWAITNMGWTASQTTREAQRFIDYALAKRATYVDWAAAWRNWCRSPFQKTEAPQNRLPM